MMRKLRLACSAQHAAAPVAQGGLGNAQTLHPAWPFAAKCQMHSRCICLTHSSINHSERLQFTSCRNFRLYVLSCLSCLTDASFDRNATIVCASSCSDFKRARTCECTSFGQPMMALATATHECRSAKLLHRELSVTAAAHLCSPVVH